MYQLVQRTIDFLTQQKQQNNNNAAKSKGGDGDVGDDSIMGGDVRTVYVEMLLLRRR